MTDFDPIASHLVSVWIGERCELEKFAREGAGRLWDDWRIWVAARRRTPGTPSEFARAMERRGHAIDQLPGERTKFRWHIRLKGGGVKSL